MEKSGDTNMTNTLRVGSYTVKEEITTVEIGKYVFTKRGDNSWKYSFENHDIPEMNIGFMAVNALLDGIVEFCEK